MTQELSCCLPVTLEDHFENLASRSQRVKNLHSLWVLFRKDMEDLLPHSHSVYMHYSLHDVTHSRSVIQAIERFLGEERIQALSATDTFMLLACSYAHDYGMAMTFNLIYDALGTPDFLQFLEKQDGNGYTLPTDELQAVKNLLAYMKDRSVSASLQELYFSIMVVIQTYLRPSHWKGIERIWNDFGGLFGGRLNGRFIQGTEGIIEICEAHGKNFSDVMKMGIRADGIVGDDFHPRFIAAMLRLGDLLDLDNGRFPRWFVNEVSRNRGLIPKLSELHYKKHEAISHLLITPKRIEVCALCNSSLSGYEVAGLVREWLEWLETECKDQILHWSDIVQPDFGRPPQLTKADIFIDGRSYASKNYKLQMRMSQDRVMKLLEGTSIYKDRYVGIRELVQNAVDASLLQLWYDVTQNRYFGLGISKFGHKIKDTERKIIETTEEKVRMEENKGEVTLLEWGPDELNRIFKNYSITVELIYDKKEDVIQIVIKDKGTGVTPNDVQHMSDIGTSKEKNEVAREIMKNMPRWLKPSGVFGIGLQSAFQLTNEIEFYTRRPNEPERQIIFHSYGRNHGKIEIREVSLDTEGIFYNNAIPGTNVKITVSPEKIRSGQDDESKPFQYYDMEFDEPNFLHALFVELSRVIEDRLRECPCDYFDIYFRPIEKLKDGTIIKNYRNRCRYSYFSPLQSDTGSHERSRSQLERNSILPFFSKGSQGSQSYIPFSFSKDTAYFADEETCRIHQLTLRLGRVNLDNAETIFQLPDPVSNLYHFLYKFNPISNAQFIYSQDVRKARNRHAGFLCWQVNIMDDKPEKYLNIDRDRLRDGAICEEELIQTRQRILQEWCEYFIRQYEQKEIVRKNRNITGRAVQEYRGKVQEFQPELHKNIFKDSPETLISLALLFYQDVPGERFQKFMEPYIDFIKSKNWKLQDEVFTVEKLWDKDSNFKLVAEASSKWINSPHVQGSEAVDEKEHTPPSVLPIAFDTISRLPHRLVHITGISWDMEGRVTYFLKLNPSHHNQQEPDLIYMDHLAQVFDCCDAIDPDPNGKRDDTDIDSLVRKLFKPNRKYSHLVVPKYPINFQRGANFSLPLDYCIQWYILSPFDRQLTRWLRELLTKEICIQEDGKIDKRIVQEIRNEVQEHMKRSEQAKKCVEYVYKTGTQSVQTNDICVGESLKETIRKEYTLFLQECCAILVEYRDQISNRRRAVNNKEKR